MDMDRIKWLIQILEMTVSRRSRGTRERTACASPFSANLSQRTRFRDSRDQINQIRRESAQACLQQMAETKLHEFVQQLSAVLVTVDASPVARKAAGLQLKNQLISEDPDMKFQYQQRWLTIPVETRKYIKNNILGALGMENNTRKKRPSSVARCVAHVAVTELALPVGQWSELIPLLVDNVESSSNEMMRQATLETIGYIWQEITYDIYSTSQHVRLAALRVLYNSMELFKGNFEIETERNFLMEIVCKDTQHTNTQIREAALQCLVKIMSLYYQYMEPFMAPALFPITLEAMESDIDEVALQGIEFWSNVFEPLVSERRGRPPLRIYVRPYPEDALQYLILVLVKKLTMQEEFDENDGSLSNAAGRCLMLLLVCCTEHISYVLPFVMDNIMSLDRKYRFKALRIIDFLREFHTYDANRQRYYLKNVSKFFRLICH